MFNYRRCFIDLIVAGGPAFTANFGHQIPEQLAVSIAQVVVATEVLDLDLDGRQIDLGGLPG